MKKSYSEKIEEIDTIISDIQSKDMDLDEITTLITKATKLIKDCKSQIVRTEEKLSKIIDG
jgi:exodeoxyribonuclease VII small subunit